MGDTQLQKPLVCLDKSFARAVGTPKLAMLSERWEFLVPSAFYFEVFDPEPCNAIESKNKQNDRRNTLSGIACFRHIHLPKLLHSELELGKPCQEVTSPVLEVNPHVLSDDWLLAPDELTAVERYRKETVQEKLHFWKQVIQIGVAGLTECEHSAARGTEDDFISVCLLLREDEVIRRVAAESGFAHAGVMDERWVHYRKFQAWALQGLVLWRRHQVPSDQISDRRLEHDLQDIEYLILGMHSGRLATNDISRDLKMASLGWRFDTLFPNGRLITPASMPKSDSADLIR